MHASSWLRRKCRRKPEDPFFCDKIEMLERDMGDNGKILLQRPSTLAKSFVVRFVRMVLIKFNNFISQARLYKGLKNKINPFLFMIGILFVYMALTALLFSTIQSGWSFLESFYFCLISLVCFLRVDTRVKHGWTGTRGSESGLLSKNFGLSHGIGLGPGKTSSWSDPSSLFETPLQLCK